MKSLEDQIKTQFWHSNNLFENQVCGQVWMQIYSQVYRQVQTQVSNHRDQVMDRLKT